MADNIVPFDQNKGQSNESPFDSIRRFDEQGNECWYARDLMDLLGYEKWQKFKGSIDIAQENLETSGEKGLNHFLPLEVKSNGRPAVDYKMSRLACYHTALACDSRGKSMVKAAKHYFAVKTREAEVVIPAQSDRLRHLELENENMRLKLQMMDRVDMLKLSAPALVEAIILPGVTIVEKAEYIDRTVIVASDGQVVSQLDGIGITAIQKQFGFKSTKAAWAWLESIGYGKESGHWQQELTAHETAKLPRSVLSDLREKFAQHKGNRQTLIGE